MAITLPNLDRIAKDDIKVEEAFRKIQNYTNQNVAPAAGNANTTPQATSAPTASSGSSGSTNPQTVPPPPRVPPPSAGGGRGINQT